MFCRVNLDNPDWVHPTTRNDVRYHEDDDDANLSVSGIKKSRFLRKSKDIKLSYKDAEPVIAIIVNPNLIKETNTEQDDKPSKTAKPVEKNSRGMTIVEYPADPDDLEPLPRPKPKNIPDYHGW